MSNDIKDVTYEIEDRYLSPYAFKSRDTAGRVIPVEECKIRTEFQRDRDRINNLVYNLVENSAGKPYITLSDEFERALDGLRSYMFANLYTQSEAKYEEVKAKRLIESLFDYFVKNPDELPDLYKNLLSEYGVQTVVCDYIAAMSDRYAVKVFSDIYIPKGWQEKSREF